MVYYLENYQILSLLFNNQAPLQVTSHLPEYDLNTVTRTCKNKPRRNCGRNKSLVVFLDHVNFGLWLNNEGRELWIEFGNKLSKGQNIMPSAQKKKKVSCINLGKNHSCKIRKYLYRATMSVCCKVSSQMVGICLLGVPSCPVVCRLPFI